MAVASWLAGKPVGRHLGQVDGADDEAGAAGQPTQRQQAEALRHRGDDAADGQAPQASATSTRSDR